MLLSQMFILNRVIGGWPARLRSVASRTVAAARAWGRRLALGLRLCAASLAAGGRVSGAAIGVSSGVLPRPDVLGEAEKLVRTKSMEFLQL